MAGRGYVEEYSYAVLSRWDNLSGRWVDHFNQDVLVEVIWSQRRPVLLCRTYNGPQSVRVFAIAQTALQKPILCTMSC